MMDNNKDLYKEINSKFDELIKEFNLNGTEFSRRLSDKVVAEKKYINERLNMWKEWKDEHEAEQKSDLVSIKQGQSIFLEEIFPKMKNKIDVAIGKTQQACMEANNSRKSAKIAEDSANQCRKLIINLVVGLIFTAITIGVPSFLKLVQDSNNQKETVKYLQQLSESLNAFHQLK